MKKTIFILSLLAGIVFNANAQYKKDGTPDMRFSANKQGYSTYTPSLPSSSVRYQSGYVKDNGTYVQSHVKTNVNSTNLDNFSTASNANPYTGTTGSRAQDYSPEAKNYGSGKTIQTGVNGGQYYFNSSGNKIYVPKRGGY